MIVRKKIITLHAKHSIYVGVLRGGVADDELEGLGSGVIINHIAFKKWPLFGIFTCIAPTDNLGVDQEVN